VANVELRARNRRLHLSVRDDGVGGAIADGSGLVGLTDRVEALGGTILIDSTPGHGTKLEVDLPINLVERTSG
jgi:signal transduction histidine kinase